MAVARSAISKLYFQRKADYVSLTATPFVYAISDRRQDGKSRLEPSMNTRTLGGNGLVSSAIGLGCLGMSGLYGPADEAESIRTIHHAADLGVTLLDTSDFYGAGANEELVGKAIRGNRDNY